MKVGKWIVTPEDYRRLQKLALQYETGRITQARFVREFYKILKKYDIPKSAIWEIQYELVKAPSKYYLVKAILRFSRPEREPFNWRHYERHPIQVTVFKVTSGKELLDTVECIEVLSEQIIRDLLFNWNRGLSAPVVYFDEEHSSYKPPIIEGEYEGFTEDKAKKLIKYLDEYNHIAQNPVFWENYTPTPFFRVSEHVCSHYIACGKESDKQVIPDEELLELLDVECPCKETGSFPVSESLTVYANCKVHERCVIWKKGGWRTGKGAIYMPPKSGRPPSKKPPGGAGVKKKKKEEEVEKTKPLTYPNPLKVLRKYGIRITDVHPKFWDTLKLCYRYGLNPIPILPDSKSPAIKWDYLLTEPIKPEHFLKFKDPRYNIGIMAGYNNVVIVDFDIHVDWNIPTLIDLTRRGNHYYFYADNPEEAVANFGVKGTKDGKVVTKGVISIKAKGYVVAPPSVVQGFEYKWINTSKPVRVTAKRLRIAITNFWNNYIDDIIEILKERGEVDTVEKVFSTGGEEE